PRVLLHQRIGILGQPGEHGAVGAIAGVAERNGHVAQQTAPLGPLHRAPAEAPAEPFVVDLRQLGEVRRDLSWPGLERRAPLVAAPAVPGTHVLADVAPEDLAAHARP